MGTTLPKGTVLCRSLRMVPAPAQEQEDGARALSLGSYAAAVCPVSKLGRGDGAGRCSPGDLGFPKGRLRLYALIFPCLINNHGRGRVRRRRSPDGEREKEKRK